MSATWSHPSPGGPEPSPGTAATTVDTTVTVRYWAAARAAAQRREDVVAARTLADALHQVRLLHEGRPRLAAILAISSLLVGDHPVGSRAPEDVCLRAGDVVEVLPPFAGG